MSTECQQPPHRRYAVFISYRHSDNTEMGRKWANWLHEALENYEVPPDLVGKTSLRGDKVPASLYPVFRDEEELPADADLSTNIRRALENSGLLVVLCSPRAVSSRFVADEIRHFKELGKSDRILALMIDGEPNASDDPEKQKRFGAEVECFPEPLRFGAPDAHEKIDWTARTEPIAADVRPGGRCEQGWTTTAAYEEALNRSGHLTRQERGEAVRAYSEQLELAKLKIIAGALGVPLGELTKRDKARQLQRAKRRSRILLSLSALFALLAISAGVAGWVAKRNEKRAVKAEAKTLDTLALSYHDRAVALAENDWQFAMTHAAGALRLLPDSRLHSALAFSLLSRRMGEMPAAVPWEGQRYFKTVFDPAGKKALACLSSGPPALIDLQDGGHQILKLPSHSSGVVLNGILNANGSLLLNDGRETYSWPAGTPITSEPSRGLLMFGNPVWDGGSFIAASVIPQMSGFFSGPEAESMKKSVHLLDRQSGKRTMHPIHEKPLFAVLSLPGDRFLSIGEDRKVMIFEAKTGKASQIGDELPGNPLAAAVAPSGMVAAVGYENGACLIELEQPNARRELQGMRAHIRATSLAFSPDSQLIAAGFDGPDKRGQMRVWHAPTAEPLCGGAEFARRVGEVTFDPAGERVAGVCDDGLLWLLDAGGRRLGSWTTGKTASGLVFVKGGTRIAVASDENSVQLRDPQRPQKSIRKRRLPSSATTLAPCGDDDALVMVQDEGRIHQFWSAANLAPLAKAVKHTDRIVVARGLEGGTPKMISVLESGAVEVWELDGRRLASRPGDPLFSSLTRAQLENPDLKELHTGIGADAVDAESAPGLVGIARWRLDLVKMRALANESETARAGGDPEQMVKKMWLPESGLFQGEVLILDSGLQVKDRIAVRFNPTTCKLSADAGVVASLSGMDARLHVLKKQPDGGWASLEVPAIGSSGITAILHYAVSSDGRWLAAAGGFGASVVDLKSAKPRWLSLTTGRAVKVKFAPDSRRIAVDVSLNDDSGAVQMWTLDPIRSASSLLSHDKKIQGMTFTPDSQLLLTWSDDGALKCWDTAHGRAAMQPWRTDKEIKAAAVVSDGTAVAFANTDRFLEMVALPPAGPAPQWAAEMLESLGRGQLDAAGMRLPVPLSNAVRLLPKITTIPASGTWHDLALNLAGSRDATVPGFAVKESAEWLSDIETTYADGDHTTAFMNLRELLRARPGLAVSEHLERLARFVDNRKDEMFVAEDLDGRKAGTVLEGPADIRFRWCPPGSFLMGSPAGEPGREHDETPHRVVLTRGYWTSETEVTQTQWEQVMGRPALEHAKERAADPGVLQRHGLVQPDDIDTWTSWFGPELPMIFVTHGDALEFTRKINALMPVKKVLGHWPQGGVCRLPTDAEWEFACRAGTTTAVYSGPLEPEGANNVPALSRIAWYSGNAAEGIAGPGLPTEGLSEMEVPGRVAGIHPVGRKQPNAWGLRDMLGNVSEWCLDHYREEANDGEVNPFVTIEGAPRLHRGQSIIAPALSVRAAGRAGDHGDTRAAVIGFRVILLDHEPASSP